MMAGRKTLAPLALEPTVPKGPGERGKPNERAVLRVPRRRATAPRRARSCSASAAGMLASQTDRVAAASRVDEVRTINRKPT